MELFKVTRTYKTKPMLDAMIDISKDHFDDPLFKNTHPLEKSTIFSFGRRCGHTQAIVQRLAEDKDSVAIYPSHEMKKRVIEDIRKACNSPMSELKSRIFSISEFHSSGNGIIIHGKKTVIFDCCTMQQVKDLFSSYTAFTITRTFDINAIVIVQPHY